MIEFKATPIKCLFNGENYKIYACNVDTLSYPTVKVGRYDSVTIKGDIQELNLDCEYIVKGSEKVDKYGVSYEVINIRGEKPTNISSSYNFLKEILTENQATELLKVYPNIIEMVMNGKTDNIDLSNVKGVKEATFRKIKSKIIENFKLAELVDEYAGVFSFSVIKKLYDKYTSIEKIKKDLQEQPYMCLCKLGGIGFKTADTLLLKCDRENTINFDTELISSPQRMLSCALYILDENENSGNTYMDLTTFKNQCIKLTPECKSEFTKVIINCDKIVIDGKTKRISKAKTYNIEKYISDNLKSGLENPIIWEYDIEKYRNVNGSDLTDEQMMTMSLVCKNTITILQGYGGTGKSFSTLALINMLKDNHKSYLLLAPTGRASKVLKEYTGCSTSTIHRGLGFNPAQNKWGYDEENKLYCDIVIVDESSMIDVFLFKHLIEAIDFNRTKILLIGDNAQLPSVSCGNLFHDLLNSNVFPTVWLRQVFRYGVGGLSTVATDIRNGDTTFKNSNNIVSIGEDKGFIYIPKSATEINGYIVKMYKQLVDNGVSIKDIMVLVSQNKGTYGTQELNNLIQNEINTNVSSKDIIKYGSTEFRVGDIIIQCVNDYNSYIYDGYGYNTEATTSIYNGDTGVIEKVETNGMVVRFDDGLIFITKEKFPNIKLAYAITVHKSQGSAAKYVIVSAPNSHTFMLNSNLLYVATTRAKQRCYMLTDINTYSRAIKKKENFKRQTWLIDMLSVIN